ncbi:NAD(P)/FAD-dependent oxidoreductase [Sphingomonas sabuli]|uniref:NAD(P)/FAD-dependent oxidoreductase n=1 Tax=Sphingomonas sabuli TaxID=2764186 RepID=UPI002483D53C|nr:FAD-dependent oxidoreductase [Sphingomonas sabuli]
MGGGVAGLSAAAALSADARVVVLEAEDAPGFHSSGRSATMLHYALGNPLVRALTLASRGTFEDPPTGFTDVPLGRRMPVLVHARAPETAELDALEAAIAPFAALDRAGPAEIAALCPALKTGEGGAVAALVDRNGLRLDPHALLQAYVRTLRRNGGTLVPGARAAAIVRRSGHWQVATDRGGTFEAPLLVNAAGAWADGIAAMAGVAPVGLTPLRRTIITFDAPDGADRWPFVKTVGEELYFAPESGRLLASPMDEVPSAPCDAQPDEEDVALAAYRVEQRTTLQVRRIAHKWAGLRTFAPDRVPVVGFAPGADGFFWLAGQGGFGLQTAPVMARIATALATGAAWPADGIDPAALDPARFGQAA